MSVSSRRYEQVEEENIEAIANKEGYSIHEDSYPPGQTQFLYDNTPYNWDDFVDLFREKYRDELHYREDEDLSTRELAAASEGRAIGFTKTTRKKGEELRKLWQAEYRLQLQEEADACIDPNLKIEVLTDELCTESTVYILTEKGEYLGFVGLQERIDVPPLLSFVYVLPENRGKGWFVKILQEVCSKKQPAIAAPGSQCELTPSLLTKLINCGFEYGHTSSSYLLTQKSIDNNLHIDLDFPVNLKGFDALIASADLVKLETDDRANNNYWWAKSYGNAGIPAIESQVSKVKKLKTNNLKGE